MEGERKKRILLGKMGLDAHDNGIHVVAKWLADAGFEVIYAGLYNTPQRLCQTALQEGVDAIGCSFLGGGHLFYTDRLLAQMRGKGIQDIELLIGGVIPPDDVQALNEMGVSLVFTPGTLRQEIVEAMGNLWRGARNGQV
jgi:methylmalonyl-CoA mutase C-terminal domain/subunit